MNRARGPVDYSAAALDKRCGAFTELRDVIAAAGVAPGRSVLCVWRVPRCLGAYDDGCLANGSQRSVQAACNHIRI